MTDRSTLESERDFLLQSIRRLDDEHATGALTTDEYNALRDEQTARAAHVLRRLQEGADDELSDAARPAEGGTRSRWLWPGLAAAAFVAVTAVALGGGIADRLSGDASTGTIAADSNTLLAQAREQTANGRPADALKTYDRVLESDPANPEALAYRGWLIRLGGLPNEGLKSIDASIAADPTYPDARFFKGFILFRDRQDPAAAIPELEAFFAGDPPADMVPLVQQMLDDARARAGAPAG